MITKGELFEIVKKRKLESIQKQTDGASSTEIDVLVIEAEAEKFLVLFEKIFVEETEETDSEDGPAGDIIGKIVSKIKDKIDTTIAKNTAAKVLKLILGIVKILIKIMARTRYGHRGVGGPLNVNTERGQYSRGKVIAGKNNRRNFKIKFLLPMRD